MRFFRYLFLIAPLTLITPMQAQACIVRYHPAEELKSKAAAVIVATILAKEIKGQAVAGELYAYKIDVRQSNRGNVSLGRTVVKYYNLRAHERSGVMECPLKDGSGMETNLKIGSKYRFYLKTIKNKEIIYSENID